MAALALRSARALRFGFASGSRRVSAGLTENTFHCHSFCTSPEETKEKSTIKPMNFAPGIYKAILIGQVGQPPTKKTLTNGSEIINFALGTGGMRNNRKAHEGESSETYAERSFTQWHRVCVFKPSLIGLAKQLKKGMNVYVEGNIETRIFNDPVTGNPKSFREISVRQNGRLYMMGTKPLLESELEN